MRAHYPHQFSGCSKREMRREANSRNFWEETDPHRWPPIWWINAIIKFTCLLLLFAFCDSWRSAQECLKSNRSFSILTPDRWISAQIRDYCCCPTWRHAKKPLWACCMWAQTHSLSTQYCVFGKQHEISHQTDCDGCRSLTALRQELNANSMSRPITKYSILSLPARATSIALTRHKLTQCSAKDSSGT